MPLFSLSEESLLPSGFSRFVQWSGETARSLGFASELCERLELVIEELSLNTAMHGYGGMGGSFSIHAGKNDDGSLDITLKDLAPPFNPLETAPPDTEKPLEERNPGGIGIPLVRSMSDGITYRYENGNIIRLTFRPRGPDASSIDRMAKE